jgi:flagellar biosynthesis GTPase FlhF
MRNKAKYLIKYYSLSATKELSQSTKTANNEQKENRLSEEDGGTVDFDLDEEIRKKQQLQEEEQQNNAQQQLARQSETSETLPAKKTKKKETSHSTEEPHIPEARHWTSEEIESLKSNYQLYVRCRNAFVCWFVWLSLERFILRVTRRRYSTLEEKKSQVFETVAFLLGENVTPCQVFHKLQELNLVGPDQHCPTQGS